jgi:sensor histidine kinase YesM
LVFIIIPKKIPSFLQTSIEDLFYDESENTLFVATSSKGIITLKDNQIKNHVTSQLGLNSNTCNSIKKITSSLYLIGTNNGLNSITFKENNTFEVRNLNAVLGLKNNRIYDVDFLDDIVYLATENGLLSFNLKNISSKKSNPKCLITHLKNQNNIVTNNFVFPYYKSDVSIEFSGISYINQGNLTYYYKLNGQNDSWSTSKETQINYKSLSPKKYTFSIYTVDGFGQKSAIKTIQFEITPPFWQKTGFIIFSILLLLMLLYLFIKYRLKKQQKRFEEEKKSIQMERDKAQLEKQMVELEQKALRLQMNPHFIFNALNTIKGYYSEGDAVNASSYISKFSKLLRMLLENTEQSIPLKKEIEMLEIYIKLTKIRYKDKFEYELIVDENLNTSETLIPTLLLQPMVENAIIHGLAPKEEIGKLKVSFVKKNNQLECIVEDNGIGRVASKMIQKNKEHQSKALEITNERLDLFNNNIGKSTIEIIDLETHLIPSGTKVIITIPLIVIW